MGLLGCYSRQMVSFPAGLYLPPTDDVMSEDECVFILPFSIGGNGYARRTDGSLYGEHVPKDSFDNLCSLGSHPFETDDSQNIASILRNWIGMVESGHWKIDENGVVGGMDVWKEADTEEHWSKYVVQHDYM